LVENGISEVIAGKYLPLKSPLRTHILFGSRELVRELPLDSWRRERCEVHSSKKEGEPV
jgi:hypothetical protein